MAECSPSLLFTALSQPTLERNDKRGCRRKVVELRLHPQRLVLLNPKLLHRCHSGLLPAGCLYHIRFVCIILPLTHMAGRASGGKTKKENEERIDYLRSLLPLINIQLMRVQDMNKNQAPVRTSHKPANRTGAAKKSSTSKSKSSKGAPAAVPVASGVEMLSDGYSSAAPSVAGGAQLPRVPLPLRPDGRTKNLFEQCQQVVSCLVCLYGNVSHTSL